jgi:glycerophosphoryl diester phosphodiesterase
MKKVSVTGHRGSPSSHPENSLAGFGAAFAAGADAVEMDLRVTADSQVIILHDETFARTAGHAGRPWEMKLREIQELKLSNGEQVPTLAAALENLKGGAILELKDREAALPACETVRKMGLVDRVVFSCFHGPWLLDIRMKYPGARLAFICDDRKIDSARIASSLKAEAVHLSRRAATGKAVRNAHGSGLEVHVWTVNSAWHARKFVRMGADGLITDRPGSIAEVLRKLVKS